MARKVLRTREELDGILEAGGLELAEQYDPNKSYPKSAWVFTRCKRCGTEAHYRLQYVMEKTHSNELVCRACFWKSWILSNAYYADNSACRNEESARVYVNRYGYDLVRLLMPGLGYEALLLVRCQLCGRQSVLTEKGVCFRCSCQAHPNTASHYAPPVTRDVVQPPQEHAQKRVMSINEARVTPASEVPELMEAWDDERDPAKTMVWPTGWRGMCPGDGQYRFKCKHGHHPYAFPYTYLENGCPACRASMTKGTELYLADTAPELAAEWLQERNGSWTPMNVRDNSKRTVWWRCLACGHEWQATPRARSKRDGQCCSECGKIQGSIAWTYPRIASEWNQRNPISPWCVRPHAKLSFVPLWDCPNDVAHHYRTTVASRVAGAECPECVDFNKSRIEMRYFEAAKRLFGDVRSGARFDDPSFSNRWSVDISMTYEGHKVAIEYDGAYWHQDKEEIDTRKSTELVRAGFFVVRIREEGLAHLKVDSPNYGEVRTAVSKPDIDGVMGEVLAALSAMAAQLR